MSRETLGQIIREVSKIVAEIRPDQWISFGVFLTSHLGSFANSLDPPSGGDGGAEGEGGDAVAD